MTTQSNEPQSTLNTPEPTVKNRSGPSLVWLIPLITALVGGWLVYKTLSEKGPEISVTFKTAEGIEAGKTKIKYKDIEIGVVNSVHFNSDFSRVILNAEIAKEAESFLRRDTRFWVVKPQLSLKGVSNLGTLISGTYIEIEPGQGAVQRQFDGLDQPPVVKADVEGRKIVLLTNNLGSIDTGSPIYYQGILAGEILGWELGNDRKSLFIHGFVKSPYDELVKSNTRFWSVSGLDVSVGADGIRLKTESVRSLLFGGIAFETPETIEAVRDDIGGLVFTLYENHESIKEKAYTQKLMFLLFFDSSVRGLNVGAPVEFKGIKIGSVLDVGLEFNRRDATFRIPVLIELEPQRIVVRGAGAEAGSYDTLKILVDRGLRAQLQTGNLLTGQLFVELGMHPDTPVRLVGGEAPYPELPTIPAELEQMTTSFKSILAKLENVDVERIGAELLGTLQGTNRLADGASRLVNRPDLQEALEDLKGAVKAFRSILQKVDRRVEPVVTHLEGAIAAGHNALDKAHETMGLVDGLLEPDSPAQYRFNELAEELAETARSIRALVDMLERHPNALIFGKQDPGDN